MLFIWKLERIWNDLYHRDLDYYCYFLFCYMIYLTLVLTILFLCVLLAWKEHEANKERFKFINALIAKTAEEAANLSAIDNARIKIEKPVPIDMVPLDEATDEEFMEAIGK